MKRFHQISALLLLVVTLGACGGAAVNGGEDYGDLLDQAGGLILSDENHPIGWENPQCTMCHDLENIHLVNRTGVPIDIELIHELALQDGLKSCVKCHGTNGIDVQKFHESFTNEDISDCADCHAAGGDD